MTFEEYCIKFSRRNIKKYDNGSNYSDVPRKKGRIAHNLVLDHPKSKNQSSFVRQQLFPGNAGQDFSEFQFFTFLEHFEGKISRFCEDLQLIFPSKCSKKSEKLKFRKTLPALPGQNCCLTNEL